MRKQRQKSEPQPIGKTILEHPDKLFTLPAENQYQSIIHAAAVPPRKYERKKEFKMPDIEICRFKMSFRSRNGKKKIVPSLERERVGDGIAMDETEGLLKLIRLATGLQKNQWGRYLKAAHIYMSLDKTPLLKKRNYDVLVMSLYADNIVHVFEKEYGTLPFKNSLVDLAAVKQLINLKS